jgi:hypothetical protein
MDYAKLQLVHTRSAAWRVATMTARGAAVSVLAYCADQENGGRIEGARAWERGVWREIMGVKASEIEVAVACGLLAWEGNDLVCTLWDHKGFNALKVKRANGPHGAKGGPYGTLGAKYGPLGGRPRAASGDEEPPQHNPPSEPPPSPVQSSPAQPSPERESARPREADRWPYEQGLPWAQTLVRAGCKIGRNNWPRWKALADQHGADVLAGAAQGLPETERWDDRVAEAMQASGGQAPIADAVAHKIERIDT